MRPTRLVILDLDGVVLDSPHLLAWNAAAAELRSPSGQGGPPLSERAYLERVAGKPRLVGARVLCELVGFDATEDRVQALADRKNALFQELAAGSRIFPDAQAFLCHALTHEVTVGFCTASANAGRLMRALITRGPRLAALAGALSRSLDAVAETGGQSRAVALRAVADAWAVGPQRCLVVDDAVHGVLAACGLGMTGILLVRGGCQVPDVGCGTAVIDSLRRLPPLVCGMGTAGVRGLDAAALD